MSHGDRVTACRRASRSSPSPRTRPSRSSPTRGARYYGMQFHPEVVHTPDGAKLICATSCTRSPASRATGPWPPFADEAIARIRAQVGEGRVICGLSGGVDFVGRGGADPRGDRRSADLRLRRHGLMRQGEAERGGRACSATITTSRSSTSTRPSCSSARSRASTDPEEKRKTIGAAVHRGVRRARRAQDRRRRPSSWPRARSIRT